MNITLITVIPEIQSAIQIIEGDMGLYEEANFNNRANAIDFIDFHILDRIDGLLKEPELKRDLDILRLQAEKLKLKLEDIDTTLFKQLRENIRTGIYTPSSFKKMIHNYLAGYFNEINTPDKIGYDNLDVFMNGLLSGESIPETEERKPEMVFYQKTPSRIILELLEMVDLKHDDVFFDLGSGLGQVAILVNLLSGIHTVGIEYEPAYCDYAKACTLQLNLPNVEFINADVLTGDYSKGTIFFMYTPFEGKMMEAVLDILQKESQNRAIRIFTYGPCSPFVAKQSWLTCVNGDGNNHYKLYEFRNY